MDLKRRLAIMVCLAMLTTACSKKSLPDANQSSVQLIDKRVLAAKMMLPVLRPDSYLFAEVDKSIQDTIIKRVKMDLHPDIRYYRQKSLVVRNDMPAIVVPSLKFAPTISAPLYRGDIKDDGKLLWISKDFACLYGKTADGEDIYMWAKYRDWSAVKPDLNNPSYQARVIRAGQAKVDSTYRRIQSRKGPDCWDIIVFPKGAIMFQLMDYARKNADNGKFFILDKDQSEHHVCYFKNGKALYCGKHTLYDEIKVREFSSLMNYD